jgi:hypothetical protein
MFEITTPDVTSPPDELFLVPVCLLLLGYSVQDMERDVGTEEPYPAIRIVFVV